jgi:acyl-CoA hydrolase
MAEPSMGKKISETRVEIAQMMMPSNANPAGNVHGGTIMKMIDDAAGVVAIRHARGNIVTASIDRLDFHAPVYVGNLLVLKASANCVGRTSMEIGVRVEAEDLKRGEIRHTASAYLTFVALDEQGKPKELPPLIVETEEDQRRLNDAHNRRCKRLETRNFCADGTPIP